MVGSIWDDIKQQFRYGNMLTQIILVNTGIFIFVNLLRVVLFMIYQGGHKNIFTEILRWFMGSSDWWHTLTRPWTPITYMFLHEDLMHYAFNMIVLYLYGRIFQELLGTRRTLAVYLLGGIFGYLAYVLSSFLLPKVGFYILGASAGVWGVAIATTVLRPDYPVHLILIGQIRLKYITLVLALLSIFAIDGGNTGGEIAHLGGMLGGWLFMHQLSERGNDISVPFNKVWARIAGFFEKIIDKLSGNTRLRTRTKSTNQDDWEAFRHGRSQNETTTDAEKEYQVRTDEILDKINRSGYSSLTKDEKEFLFKVSNKK